MLLRFLVRRRLRLVLLALGLLALSIGVTLIAAASRTTVVAVDQDLSRNWRTTYDILVRPVGVRSSIEEQYGLVEANHLSGIWGGITFEQYGAIKSIPGVEVAAPIAMIGYNLGIAGSEDIMLPSAPGVYVLEQMARVDDGHRLYTPPEFPQRSYYYFTQDPHTIPFDPNLPSYVGDVMVDPPFPNVNGIIEIPLFIVGIDPPQEAALVGLDRALLEGQYLRGDESLDPQFQFEEGESTGVFDFPESQINIPILINATTYVSATHQAELRHVILPLEVTNPEDILARGGTDYLDTLPAEVRAAVEMDSNTMYQRMIEIITAPDPELLFAGYGTLSTPSTLLYRRQVKPLIEQENPVLELQLPEDPGDGVLSNYRGSTQGDYKVLFFWDVKGIFDIERIPKPADVNRVPLETYFPPVATLRYDEEGQPVEPRTLRPTLNPAGYIQSPPMLLTILEAARELRGEAAISAIRVRVGGIGELSPTAQRKIEAVASEIVRRTGLIVDIMVGSSPTRVLVHVPGVGYVEEQWIQKGVNLVYQERIQSGHWLLLAALFGVGGLFTLDLAWAEVVAHRRTIALQKALGWRSSTVFGQVLGQILLMGAIAAVLGLLAAYGIARLLGWELPPQTLLAGVPLSILGLSTIGAAYPAWLASRVPPVIGLQRGGIRYRRKAGQLPVSGPSAYVWQGLIRRWSRTALSGVTAALSAALLVLLLGVTVERQGTLSGTLLGEFILVHIEGFHYAIVGVGLGLAALSTANGLLSSVVARRREIGVLKAVGWRTTAVARLFLAEGALLGGLGGLVGVVLGMGLFVYQYQVFPPSLVWIGLVGVGVPGLVGAIAALYPARVAARVPPAEAVRYE